VTESIVRAPLTGLVLSGGGARGAYEAGVIRYIRDELPPRIRRHVRFEIICGTSVGAVNCCFLAAHNHMPEVQGHLLTEMWQSLKIDGIYRVGLKELLNLPRFLFGSRGRGQLDDALGPGRLGGLFNTMPLEELVRKGVRWSNIGANLASGDLKALAINATHISTGKTHVFVQRATKGLPPWSTDPQIEAREVEITPSHALASAAIPWIFPAVEIEGEIYCDGGLKLNTPISPALRLGADRLLVIGLRSTVGDSPKSEKKPARIDNFPSAAFLLGKILNALLLDKTEYDLKRLQRFNALLQAGEEEFGAEYDASLGRVMSGLRGAPYRKVGTLVVRPSEDIATIAERHLRLGSVAARAGGIVGPFLRQMGEVSEGQASDLLSYLLFDGEFASDLIRLGMHDADAQRAKIVEFFSA